MLKKIFPLMAALLFVAICVPTAWAALANLGPSIAPHGYPAWYQDGNGLQLELCVPPPAGNAGRPDLCIFDPLELDEEGNPINPLVLTGEGFYWMAASTLAMPGGGDASIEFAIESTFGGSEEPNNGQQITFGRTRIRIDTPVAGTYTITHPYGANTFEVAVGEEEDGINMTSDIGSANFLFPEVAFRGTLTTPIGPFLTWPNYDTNEALQVLELDPVTNLPTGNILEQYVGDPNTTSTVVGGTNGNIFRVVGPEGSGIDLQNDQWLVMGKEFDPTIELALHVWPPQPEPNLFAVGPVNREAFFAIPSIGTIADAFSEDYSLGYPLWFQEALTVTNPDTQVEEQIGGLQLTLCTPGDAMCISDPIDPTNQNQVDLLTGGEGFWFHAAASFDDGDDSYSVEFALESTFGGDESIVDGGQISFARERIRFGFDDDKPVATYRVTHPYGERILEGDPERLDRIRFGSDIGITDLADPDGAHIGTLYGDVGPTFLKWDTFVDPATLAPEQLGANYPVPDLVTPNMADQLADPPLFNYHIGNPNIPHTVVGSPTGNNFFRVERLTSGTVENGTWELVGETDLFAVSGKIYDPQTFGFALDPSAPFALPDAATLDMRVADQIDINVAANDEIPVGGVATFSIVNNAVDGNAVFNNPVVGTVTYTPSADLALEGGVDTFTYQISLNFGDTVLTSAPATVTVTVIPVETITIDRARFRTRNLALDLRGTSNVPGRTLTIHAGPTVAGTVIGTVLVDDRGRWSFRGTATTNMTDVTLVSNSDDATTVTQSLDVR